MAKEALYPSLPLYDDLALAWRVEEGIPASAIKFLSELLGLGSIARTAALVHMSARTAERRVKAKARLAPAESERVVRIIRVMSRAESVLSSKESARKWMSQPLGIFRGKTPLEMSATEPGARAVEQALGRLENAVFY
jgi:putative toxin-antitoxin system antitoxin component (TIGR02293 family)